MLIKACLECKFHEIKEDGDDQGSYCKKECCWSQYSDCVSSMAIEKFLREERVIAIEIP